VLLTISTTHRPATDLGFLLHKHPERVQAFSVPFGTARVFYPEATEERCTAALLLEVDPVGLVRRGKGGGGFALAQYVNDRPYVASSLFSVALLNVFKSAASGRCADREELAATAIPLEAHLPVVPARGGEAIVRRIFEPLGYAVAVEEVPGAEGRHVALTLTATIRLADLLNHLYVLLPVLDNDKHYWIDDTEVDKLLRRGEGWLPAHPDRDLIVRRALKRQAALIHPALARLEAEAGVGEEDEAGAGEAADGVGGATGGGATGGGDAPEERVSLRDQRLGAVEAVLKSSGARRVLDLGCGPGALLRRLVKDPNYTQVTGADVSIRALETAARRLKLDELHDAQRERIALLHSPLTYRDKRFAGYDAAVLVEVVEHLDPPRLRALEENVFGHAKPSTVVVTTPNAEYNTMWETLPAGDMRHPDHRFEWTRAEFAAWSSGVAERHGYAVRHLPVGPEDAAVGAPTQMAVFSTP
jgi:3' terminal RNA ribose 2'-O-methyltransferase Hen1